jgi:cystathionine beta-lyase
MTYDFDRVIDRRPTESAKWHYYGEDVLPLWVADMDFRSPEPAIRALRDRVDHGIFGYGMEPPELRRVISDRLEHLYGWSVAPDALVFLPGVVTGLNLAIRATTSPGDGVLAQTPVYYPILYAPANAGCTLDEMELTHLPDGSYGINFGAFEAAITDRTRVFVLCNPHNPVGRVFRRGELENMAEICLRHDVVICSDEIHCDLLFEGSHHLPIASLDPDIAAQTITLMAPSKTYNIAGLNCSFAIIQNPKLRERVTKAGAGLVPHHLNLLGNIAALAAYSDGRPWLDTVLRYTEANCDYLMQYLDEHLPGVTMARPEGTYLAWLDCRGAGIPGNAHKFFLKQAKVAVNDGATFGRGGEDFVRLNFACPRSTLVEALERMRQALTAVG